LMGYASRKTNVLFCLGALDEVLNATGVKVTSGKAVAAAQAVYAAS